MSYNSILSKYIYLLFHIYVMYNIIYLRFDTFYFIDYLNDNIIDRWWVLVMVGIETVLYYTIRPILIFVKYVCVRREVYIFIH